MAVVWSVRKVAAVFEPGFVDRRRCGTGWWLRVSPLLICVVGLAAQTQPTFHIEANYVRVDVYADTQRRAGDRPCARGLRGLRG